MIKLDEAARRFTFESEAATAFLEFRQRADRFIILHTVVPPELEGEGVGSRLVTAAIDHAVSRGLTVVPICPFAALGCDPTAMSRRPSTSIGRIPTPVCER